MGVKVKNSEAGLELRQYWRKKSAVKLFPVVLVCNIILSLCIFLIMHLHNDKDVVDMLQGIGVGIIILFIDIAVLYQFCCYIINRTTIQIFKGAILVRQGPIPMLYGNKDIKVSDIETLFIKTCPSEKKT